MISFLKGKVLQKANNSIILLVADIGYKIYLYESLFHSVLINSNIEIYTHHYIKEDASDLYGFKSVDELSFFEMLLSVSGVGPKSALGVLSMSSVSDVKSSIAQGDSALLVKVSGIGKKTAERLVLELRDKLIKQSGPLDANTSFNGDEIDALVALGYTVSEARDALKNVEPSIDDVGQRIKEALKLMSK